MGLFGKIGSTLKKLGARILKDVGIDPPVFRSRTPSSSSREPEGPPSGVFTPKNWKPSWYPDTERTALIAGETWVMTPQSSNVARIGYDPFKNGGTLKIIFKDENEYHVWPMSPSEMEDFYDAGSRGSWYWDHVRVRGTKLGHQKSYVHVAGHGEVQRKWIQTPDRVVSHLRQVGDESSQAGHDVQGVIPESIPFSFFLTEAPGPPTKLFKPKPP